MPTTGKKKIKTRWGSNTCHVWFEMEPKFFWETIHNRVYEPRLHLPLTYSKSDFLNKSIQELFFFNFLTALCTTGVYGFCRQHINELSGAFFDLLHWNYSNVKNIQGIDLLNVYLKYINFYEYILKYVSFYSCLQYSWWKEVIQKVFCENLLWLQA